MSTLTEIESAVEMLPRPEQETLLRHLAHKLSTPTGRMNAGDTERDRRQQWLDDLRQLRASNATGPTGAPLQQVMDELRADPA